MSDKTYTVVSVTLEDRDDDGGLFVFSEDLPGLILSGTDKHEVCECIAPAIAALLEREGETVTVHSETPMAELLKQKSPRSVHMNVQRFIVEFKRAA